MRKTIVSALRNDPTLLSLGVAQNAVYGVDVDTPPERPFIQIRFGRSDRNAKMPVGPRTFTVWAHDTPGDYGRLDAVLKRCRVVLEAIEARAHDSGWITCIEWQSDSEDFSDDGHRTITRFSNYTVIGSGL